MPRRDGRSKLNRSIGRAHKGAKGNKRGRRKRAPLAVLELHGRPKRGGGMG